MMSTKPLGRLLQPEDVQSQSKPVRVCGKFLPENVRTKERNSMHFPFMLWSGKVLGAEEEEPLVALHGQELLLPHCNNTRERLRHLFAEASRNPHGFLLCGQGSTCPCTHDASRIVSMAQNPAASAHQAASDRGH